MSYRAKKDFLKQIKSCYFSGRELKDMMESKFKMEKMAGYPIAYVKFIQLDARLGEDKYGNNIFGSILATAPSQVNVNWKKDNNGNYHILSSADKAFITRYHFLKDFNIDGFDYDCVMNMFEKYLLNMNEPLIVAA